MKTDALKKIYRRMLWVIPGMLLAMVGDYCMGIEPKGSYAISGMISSGWLSIADWRIAVSNIGGLIGTVFYTLAALPFVSFLKTMLPGCRGKWDRRLLKLYMGGLILGVMSFLYFHLACGTLIHNFNLLYDAAGGNMERAAEGWIALIWRGTFALKKVWILAAPLIVAGIGYVLELLIPWPFNGFVSGFESFGWMVMFLGGRKLVRQAMERK